MAKQQQMFILYVADQQRSRNFYQQVLGQKPILDVPGMTEFTIPGTNMLLGLMPESGIAKILDGKTVHPEKGNGIPRCELYLVSDDPDKKFKDSIKAGAREISKSEIRSWGAYVAYVMDLDGNIIAFAGKT